MSKFKKGDKVRCLRGKDSCDELQIGAIYEVAREYVWRCTYQRVALTTTTNNGILGWNTNRFELVTPTANSYRVRNETHAETYGHFFTINEATEYILQHGIAGHTYTVQEHIERRKFEVVEKVQRELKAI
jgi:hypothetical protein